MREVNLTQKNCETNCY